MHSYLQDSSMLEFMDGMPFRSLVARDGGLSATQSSKQLHEHGFVEIEKKHAEMRVRLPQAHTA